MAIINNNFYADDVNSRSSRVSLLQHNIDGLAAELGVTGDLLIWAQNCEDQWRDISMEARLAKAQTNVEFSKFQSAFAECKKHYQKAKDLLKAIVTPHDNADEILRAYSIDGRTPLSRDGLESAVDDLSRQHEIYKAAGDPWVLPDHIVAELIPLRTEMSELHTAACTQRERAKVLREVAKNRFREDTHRLKLIYKMGVVARGVDSPNFLTLGMLPKSMVWTKKRPPAPENFRFDAVAKTFHWSFIDGADSYEAHYREAKTSGHWTTFYEGAENSCSPPDGISGTFDFRVRAIAKGKEGHWSGGIEESLQN